MVAKTALGLAFFVLQAVAHEPLYLRRAHHEHALHARQSQSSSSSPGSASASGSSSTSSSVSAQTPAPVASGAPNTAGQSTLTATDPSIPPLASIVSNEPSKATPQFTQTFSAGASPPISGAPALPSTTLDRSKYPAPTQVAPTDTDLVRQWMKELDGVKIPDIPPTTNEALCDSNKDAAADSSRCWWTCGGCTRDSDIHTCPNKMDWGVSFDDGPSAWSPKVLDFLDQKKLQATFFVVGSSIYWNPGILQAEYMKGHQLAVHTWFHQHMTTLTNEQVVAELGYAREIVKDVTGTTPMFWRPPFGDVDDRVRAIALGMGLKTIIWTRNPTTKEQFDTNDWQIPAGNANGPSSFAQFQNILTNATQLDTGFIVLEHDLYEQTVELATGYTLPAALSHNPSFNLKSINQCLGKDIKEAYLETASDKSMPQLNSGWTGNYLTGLGDGSGGNSSSGGSSSGSGSKSGGGGGSNQGSGAGRVELGAGALLGGVFAMLMTFLA